MSESVATHIVAEEEDSDKTTDGSQDTEDKEDKLTAEGNEDIVIMKKKSGRPCKKSSVEVDNTPLVMKEKIIRSSKVSFELSVVTVADEEEKKSIEATEETGTTSHCDSQGADYSEDKEDAPAEGNAVVIKKSRGRPRKKSSVKIDHPIVVKQKPSKVSLDSSVVVNTDNQTKPKVSRERPKKQKIEDNSQQEDASESINEADTTADLSFGTNESVTVADAEEEENSTEATEETDTTSNYDSQGADISEDKEDAPAEGNAVVIKKSRGRLHKKSSVKVDHPIVVKQKRGRPSKVSLDSSLVVKVDSPTKPKTSCGRPNKQATTTPTPKNGGRRKQTTPKKHIVEDDDTESSAEATKDDNIFNIMSNVVNDDIVDENIDEDSEGKGVDLAAKGDAIVKRKCRGRPKKSETNEVAALPKKRGRSSKVAVNGDYEPSPKKARGLPKKQAITTQTTQKKQTPATVGCCGDIYKKIIDNSHRDTISEDVNEADLTAATNDDAVGDTSSVVNTIIRLLYTLIPTNNNVVVKKKSQERPNKTEASVQVVHTVIQLLFTLIPDKTVTSNDGVVVKKKSNRKRESSVEGDDTSSVVNRIIQLLYTLTPDNSAANSDTVVNEEESSAEVTQESDIIANEESQVAENIDDSSEAKEDDLAAEDDVTVKRKSRGRSKKFDTNVVAAPKKRGRPSKTFQFTSNGEPTPKKARGRPKKQKVGDDDATMVVKKKRSRPSKTSLQSSVVCQ